ncbi:hypothetical protein AVEN_251202-1 [Araneus ventricosus]|uniref:Uncharacterized protein n=1 Tax=Araneus ventricosus TaxID=182803 RepID=A0A4Y2MVW1_ARAVE|nr:hypothetical protein AVEN_251202-1 [Araneus ventricosus]
MRIASSAISFDVAVQINWRPRILSLRINYSTLCRAPALFYFYFPDNRWAVLQPGPICPDSGPFLWIQEVSGIKGDLETDGNDLNWKEKSTKVWMRLTNVIKK